MEIQVTKASPDIPTPTLAENGSLEIQNASPTPLIVMPYDTYTLRTGISVILPAGVVGRIVPNISNINSGLQLLNQSEYVVSGKEIKLKFKNLSNTQQKIAGINPACVVFFIETMLPTITVSE